MKILFRKSANFVIANIFIFLFFISPGLAAEYYVDFSGGNDNNVGTSKNSSFKHYPGDDNATGNASKIALKGGDIVKFKGGVVYKGRIDVKWSGSSNNSRIVYDGNSAGDWGSGKAIINGSLTHNRGFEILNVDNITAKNFEITNQAKGRAVSIENASNIIVQNCYIHRIYDWDLRMNTNAKGSYVQSIGSGIRIDGDSYNVLIDGCEITRTGGQGIGIKGSSKKVEVKNSKLHDYINWVIDIAPLAGRTISDVFIHDNELYNMYHYSSDFWTGKIKDEKVNYSTNPNPHQDGIFIRNPLKGTLSNIRIYNNNFYNDIELSGAGGTAQLFTSETRTGDSIYIYNNTFQNPYPYISVAIGWLRQGKIHLYNNTFHMTKSSALQIAVYADWGTPTAEVYLKNNIFNMESSGYPLKLWANRDATRAQLYSVINSDYNLFRTSKYIAAGDTGYTKTLADWQAKSGGDIHSEEVSDIKFVSAKYPPYCSSSNLELAEGAMAIDAGVTLASHFSFDQDNRPRPRGRQWDMGAFEFDGGAAIKPPIKPQPPENLRINAGGTN